MIESHCYTIKVQPGELDRLVISLDFILNEVLGITFWAPLGLWQILGKKIKIILWISSVVLRTHKCAKIHEVFQYYLFRFPILFLISGYYEVITLNCSSRSPL